MQRLSAARRLRAGAVDRQAAIGGLLPSAIVVLGAAPFERAPLPEIFVRDPAAARCFRVRATGRGSLPDFGVEVDRCLSADGISLLQRVVRPPGVVDAQVATAVRRRASVRDIEALAQSFAPRPSSSQRKLRS